MSSGVVAEKEPAEKGAESRDRNSRKCAGSGEGKQDGEGACTSKTESVDGETLEAQTPNNRKETQGVLDFRDKVPVQNSGDERIQAETQAGKTNCENSSDVKHQQHMFKEVCGKRKSSQLCGSMGDSNCDDSMGLNDVVQCCSKKRRRCERKAFVNCKFQDTALRCVGILPGLGSLFDSSDDSDMSGSSGSESNEKYDLVGRRVEDSKGDSGRGTVIPRVQLKYEIMELLKNKRFFSRS